MSYRNFGKNFIIDIRPDDMREFRKWFRQTLPTADQLPDPTDAKAVRTFLHDLASTLENNMHNTIVLASEIGYEEATGRRPEQRTPNLRIVGRNTTG